MAATDIRPKITLACQECKRRNYITRKNRRNDPDRLELKKYCPHDNRHSVHASVILGRTSEDLLAMGEPLRCGWCGVGRGSGGGTRTRDTTIMSRVL